MVEIYSHSKLSLFESCPEAYKIKYIDKTFPELPVSMSLFLGSVVHESLEWLYEEVREGRVPTLEALINDFATRWQEQFTQDIRIFNATQQDSLNKGVKFLIDYYQGNFPFKENTLFIEKKILFPLDEKGDYLVQGFIDRLVLNDDEEYEVHDYKTNESMKSQNEVDRDRQLAFYHLGLQELFGKDIKVKLMWHFLAHNRTVESRRTEEQLARLKRDTLELIRRIEEERLWPACGKPWCDWCAYKKSLKYNNEGNHDLKRFF